ncbi:hypothetical protein BASA82_000266 [Batrachochytrium salamandrivorans]|nr:hypothetical protein BASA82_000266 [Batrachochytrium salamandrivorans]
MSVPNYGQYVVPTADILINLKVGQPSPNGLLPLETVREAAAAKFAETDPEFLQYGNIYGFPAFRKALVGFLSRRYGAEVKEDHVMATNGNTGCLSLLLSLFTKSGDLVFAEEPTYFLAKSIFKDFKLNLEQIPQDVHGLDVDKLEARLKQGNIPKLIYVIPTAHNPSGRTMPAERRAKLAKLSAEYKFLVIADEVYQMLTFPHITPPPPMFTYDEAGTILCMGSFSKILAPGLRVGWLQASPALLAQIAACGQLDSSGGLNPVAFGIVEKTITLGTLDKHIDFARAELFRRYTALSNGLSKYLPKDVTFEVPQGGYFCIVRLPDGHNAKDLIPTAEKHKVMFLPGAAFSQTMDQYCRLSFSYYSAEDLDLAAKRLSEAIAEFLGNKKLKQGA